MTRLTKGSADADDADNAETQPETPEDAGGELSAFRQHGETMPSEWDDEEISNPPDDPDAWRDETDDECLCLVPRGRPAGGRTVCDRAGCLPIAIA